MQRMEQFRVWKSAGPYPRGSGFANGKRGGYYIVKAKTKVKVLGKTVDGWDVMLDTTNSNFTDERQSTRHLKLTPRPVSLGEAMGVAEKYDEAR